MKGLHRWTTTALGLVLSAAVLAAIAMLAGCTASSGTASRGVAPDFSGTTLGGAQVSLGDYQGEPLVLVFMASWCAPCRAEAPEIEEFYLENKDRAAVLGVAVQDSEEDLSALMADNGWTFPVMFDGTAAAYAYGVTSIPTTVVIDPEGHIVKKTVGGTTAAKLSLVIDGITR